MKKDKIYIIAGNTAQAEDYTKSKNLRKSDYIYLRDINDLRGKSKDIKEIIRVGIWGMWKSDWELLDRINELGIKIIDDDY